MAYIGITARDRGDGGRDDGLSLADGGTEIDALLARRLDDAGHDAPVIVLIHGYRFDPFEARRALDDPHRSLFAFEPERRSARVRSWPQGLGCDPRAPERGLCIGFGWRAAEPHLPSLLAEGRSGFARVYDRAGATALLLARLLARIEALAPGRTVDIVAHSLGARVALAALPHLDKAPGRIVLLGAAEFDRPAREALARMRAPRPPEIYNVTARANDVYDAAFEAFAPRRSWRDRAIGLGIDDPQPYWLDMQLDHPDVTDWINGQGIPLTPAKARFCHWSFYTRPGAFEVYQAILRRRRGWDVPTLRCAPCFATQEPRWSRFALPRLRLRPALAADPQGPALEGA